MRLFKETSDFFKGASISEKKAYSPFLSAALLYFPDFKIKNMECSFQGATLYKQVGSHMLYLSVLNALGGNYSIDELNSTIFSFLDISKRSEVEKIKPLNEFLSLNEYSNYRYRNIGKTPPLYEKIRYNFLRDYIELKKNRSYIRYLSLPENINRIDKISNMKDYEINHYREQSLNEIRNSYGYMIGGSLLYNTDLLKDDNFIKDCIFKNISPKDRLEKKSSHEYKVKFGDYQFMDNWHLTLEVKENSRVIYEDIAIIGGVDAKGFRMFEDDYIFMANGIEKLMDRLNDYLKNNRK